MSDDRYPVGRHAPQSAADAATRRRWISSIRDLPGDLDAVLRGLGDDQLDTAYRKGGWTIRQVVHHVADSHMNAYCRFKLALSEEDPTIRPYDQDGWAALPDSKLDVAPSLGIIRGVHLRLVCLLGSMSDADFERPLVHPDIGPLRVVDLLDIYQWHGRHHVGHIRLARDRHGW